MRLFIAEKPNLAKAIANGLGNGRTESGCIRCGDDVVTWCFGHARTCLAAGIQARIFPMAARTPAHHSF